MNIPISQKWGEETPLKCMTILYVITCDIGVNSIHIYIYIYIIENGKCQYSVCNVSLCKWIVMSVLYAKMENYKKKKSVSFNT
jgi:hypothetical protein